MSRGDGMSGVRIREGTFEGQCAYCREYLPLDPEFWPMNGRGLRRCKACIREYKAMKERGYKATKRDLFNAANRVRLAFMAPEERERRNAKKQTWRAANLERVAAYERAYRARRRAA
jgi:hypothetical protein